MSEAEKTNTPPQKAHGPMGGMSGDKAKNFKGSLKKFLVYIKPFWGALIAGIILAALGTIFAILGPKILQSMNEEILKGLGPVISIDFGKIFTIGIWLLALYVVSSILTFIESYIMAGVSARVSQKMRSEISTKINKLPLKYFDRESYGNVLSRVTNDIDTISMTLNQSLGAMISSATMLIGIVVMMFTISWELTVVALISIPVSMALVMLVVKVSQKHFRKQQNSLGEVNGHIEEIYSAHTVVKAFNGEKDAEEKFDKINGELYKSAYKSQFLSGLMMPVMNFVGNLTYVFVCVIGGAMALNDPLFIAAILSFVIYIRQFNQPIAQMATITNTLQSTAAAAERVFDMLEQPEQEDESEKNVTLGKVKGQVEFRDVYFGYEPDRIIIKDFDCIAKPGQKIAIVGPTGAGKTTIVNLLMRFYEVNDGDILIDGVSIKDMRREYVRSLFGMVLQDTWLFEGTIRENIAFGKPNATQKEIEHACKMANVDHFIKTLPGGYDMMLDEDANLSQGQKQLLTIARAMVQNSPMLILDEATSSVDTRTEELISEAMDRLMKGRTSFVIAHRLSTIKNADLILVMKEGNIIEKGTHDELMKKKGFYADLYNSQFSKNYLDEENIEPADKK